MANSEELQFLINTNWPNYLENIVVCLDKKCLGLSNYKWGYFMNPIYTMLNNSSDLAVSNNCNIGYIYCKNNLFLRFRFIIMWQNELRITIDTLKYGEATSFEEHANLVSVPIHTQRNNTSNIFKNIKVAKKPNFLANDVISLLIRGEEVIKSIKGQIEAYVIQQSQMTINIDKIKTALNLSEDYLKENYIESSCTIDLPYIGYVELLKLNLCKIKTGYLYLSIDTLIELIRMIDKETQELGKSPKERYYAK